MSLFKRIKKRAEARKFRVRNKVARVSNLTHKVVVFRSNKNLYASLVEFKSGKTVFGFSSLNICDKKKVGTSCNNKDFAKIIGEGFGKKCLENGVSKVAFDRGGYLYHGKVAALADGIRSVGVSL